VSGVPDLEDMLLPPVGSSGSAGGKPPAKGKPTGKPASGSSTTTPSARSSATAPNAKTQPGLSRRDGTQVLVQMSREWIEANMLRAVGSRLERMVLTQYSRHLVYSPMWLPSMAQHAKAVAEGAGDREETHRDHDVLPNLHYEEAEVKVAVNKKKAALRMKYGNLSSLRQET
jgi:hypothetical protein